MTKRKITITTASLVLLLLGGCIPPRKIDLDKAQVKNPLDTMQKQIPELYLLEQKILRDGKKPELGLALSGGGIRSSLFSIGVMKALYDMDNGKTFNQIDVISSVSGGSYASYWLYNNEIAANGKSSQFGAATFQNKNYNRHMWKMSQVANMYSPLRAAGTALLPRKILIADYETRMHQTFSQGKTSREGDLPKRVTFGELSKLVRNNRVPYPVINTTISSKLTDDFPVNTPARRLEFTTTHIGNPYMNTVQPLSEYSNVYVSKAVAASGAAAPSLLYHNHKNWNSEYPKEWPIYDGGQNDNLGAMSLVRRGVKEMIIIDGEHSPNYTFEAVEQLSNNLNEIGMSIHLEDTKKISLKSISNNKHNDRSNVLESAIFTGYIYKSGGNKNSKDSIKLTYVRLSYSNDLRKMRIYSDEKLLVRKKMKWDNFFTKKDKTQSNRINELYNAQDCLMTIDCYSSWLHKSGWKRWGHKVNSLNYSFPQMSTADQNMSKPDKIASLLSLGYLQGLQLQKALKK